MLDPTNTGDKLLLEWIQIDCGGHRIVGLTNNGEVFMCNKSVDQLVHGELLLKRHDGLRYVYDENDYMDIPLKVLGLDGLVIIKVSCGEEHTAALTDKGEILTWYVR